MKRIPILVLLVFFSCSSPALAAKHHKKQHRYVTHHQMFKHVVKSAVSPTIPATVEPELAPNPETLPSEAQMEEYEQPAAEEVQPDEEGSPGLGEE